jgi:flavodoxin I
VTPILILYASTSGSTRLLVQSIVHDLHEANVECQDIKALDSLTLAGRDLIILATPTYGTGDWHNAWDEKGAKLLADLPPNAKIALLGLGDSRGHRKSFAGGIAKLAALARSRDANLVGAVPLCDYDFEASPAAEDGMFPGLVVEYRRNRNAAAARAVRWVRGLLQRDSDL